MDRLKLAFRKSRVETRRRLATELNPVVLVERIRGRTIIGRDERGAVAETKEPQKLNITVNGWLVELETHKDDLGFLSTLMPKEADRLVKRGKQRRRKITMETDLFHAVRATMHMKESYRKEYSETKALVEVEELNARLAVMDWHVENSEIDEMIKDMNEMGKKLKRQLAAPKKQAFEKLQAAIKTLEELKKETGAFKRTNRLSVACSRLVAFRNRYNEIRLGEILIRGSRANLRERTLRILRDRHIQSMVNQCIRYIEKNDGRAFAYRTRYMKEKEVVRVLEELTLSNVGEIFEKVKAKKVRKGKNILLEVEKDLENGDKKAAYSKLRRMYQWFGVDKPFYMVEELEKTNEEYMIRKNNSGENFISYLKSGSELLERGVFPRAVYCFRKALELLPPFVV